MRILIHRIVDYSSRYSEELSQINIVERMTKKILKRPESLKLVPVNFKKFTNLSKVSFPKIKTRQGKLISSPLYFKGKFLQTTHISVYTV